MTRLYEFDVKADPTWLARRFGDEVGLFLDAKLRTRPSLNKIEAAIVVRLIARLLNDQVKQVGEVGACQNLHEVKM